MGPDCRCILLHRTLNAARRGIARSGTRQASNRSAMARGATAGAAGAVEPHFLFNTLAHVQRLYQTDPACGSSMLDSFCDYVRAALPQMRGNRSTLGREVELGRAYLDTQRIRMDRRLRYEIAIPEKLLAAGLPTDDAAVARRERDQA